MQGKRLVIEPVDDCELFIIGETSGCSGQEFFAKIRPTVKEFLTMWSTGDYMQT